MNVIEILLNTSRFVSNEDYVQFMAAVDGIAELIEADKEYDSAYAAAVDNPAKEAWLADAEERRAAALANVGGAA